MRRVAGNWWQAIPNSWQNWLMQLQVRLSELMLSASTCSMQSASWWDITASMVSQSLSRITSQLTQLIRS